MRIDNALKIKLSSVCIAFIVSLLAVLFYFEEGTSVIVGFAICLMFFVAVGAAVIDKHKNCWQVANNKQVQVNNTVAKH